MDCQEENKELKCRSNWTGNNNIEKVDLNERRETPGRWNLSHFSSSRPKKVWILTKQAEQEHTAK